MSNDVTKVTEQLMNALSDLHKEMPLSAEHILVVGTSTSEVKGSEIGTAGSLDISEALYHGFLQFQEQTGVRLAFQCCEHLNRALVVERQTAKEERLEEVSVIPVQHAGGSMATYAFTHMKDPVVVETIAAHAGIDIGDTLIGMHLKRVAVPVRSVVKKIGAAHITLARTRPKLIGGERAVYSKQVNIEDDCY
ncbi:MAG TPA: TIGR01440 family protein [Bacilli bacterium]|nr:TIGR01440 family protein [Bacilli bacterium]